ncbi:methyltransferase domain-containing protein [Streptomyces sp. NPDC050610]|uniref:SAM-dependent methyltransferase n=1 Tax=Streptomyces sp. NPDC050610 TaxID=3157097 RepID=UPI0034385176
MAATASGASGAGTGSGPTPDQVGEMYDEFGDMLGMLLGGTAVHIGMYVPHDEQPPVTSLVGLADAGQDKQTEFLIDTIGLKPDAHLLDIGCGTGGPAIRLAERSGGRVTGITVSRGQLAHCEERLRASPAAGRVEFARENAMNLGYADASFDAAWSIDCIPHLSDRLAGLREAHRVLRPGGRLLMTEFTLRGVPDATGLAAYTQLWTCPPPRPLPELLTEVAAAGFRVAKIQSMTSNVVLSAELMNALYQQRRDEIEERYGKETTAHTDPLIGPFRDFCRDNVDYYLLLLCKEGE